MAGKAQVSVHVSIWLEEPTRDAGEGVLERNNQDVVGAWMLRVNG